MSQSLQVVYPSSMVSHGIIENMPKLPVQIDLGHNLENEGFVDAEFFLQGDIGEEMLTHKGESFHSINSESSIIKQIDKLEVEQPILMITSGQSDSTKRKNEDNTDDTASTTLKRRRN